MLPFFSYHLNFCCRIFPLPNFPLPIFPVAVFSVAFFPLPLFHTLFLCCPVFLPSYFSLPIFHVVQFSGCRFFCYRFFQFPFLPLPFCRESHMHVTQVRAAFPIRLAGILSNCRTGRWLNFYLRLGACLHLNNWCEPTVYLRHWAEHLCPILFLSGVSTITSVRYVDYIFFE